MDHGGCRGQVLPGNHFSGLRNEDHLLLSGPDQGVARRRKEAGQDGHGVCHITPGQLQQVKGHRLGLRGLTGKVGEVGPEVVRPDLSGQEAHENFILVHSVPVDLQNGGKTGPQGVLVQGPGRHPEGNPGHVRKQGQHLFRRHAVELFCHIL